jgi:hypothetical protein
MIEPEVDRAFLRRRRIVLGAGILLSGCAEPYRVPGTEAPGPRRIATLDVQGRVEVLQQGRLVTGADGMPLYFGDEIRTFPSTYAQCRFDDGDRVWLDYDTRVRMGSIFTFFGRVFAAVSGVFQVDSEFVAASSEGTEYAVTIGRGLPEFAVAVRRGTVVCQPRQGRWRPVRLAAGQRLIGRDVAPPRIDVLDTREYEAEFGWVTAGPAPQLRFRQPAPQREPDRPPRSSPPPSAPPSSAPSSPPRPAPGSTTPAPTSPGTGSPGQIAPRPRSGIRERIERPSAPSSSDPR